MRLVLPVTIVAATIFEREDAFMPASLWASRGAALVAQLELKAENVKAVSNFAFSM